MRRVPETPEQLGLLVLTSQLRRNAQRGMLGGALSLPLLGITEAKRGDWVIAALLCAATLLQCLLVVLKLRKINQILDGLANPAAAGAGPVANPTQVTLLLGLGMTIALLGLVGLSPDPPMVIWSWRWGRRSAVRGEWAGVSARPRCRGVPRVPWSRRRRRLGGQVSDGCGGLLTLANNLCQACSQGQA